MLRRCTLFIALFFIAQISGASLVVWLDNNPVGIAPAFFIEKIQHSIRALTIALPVLAATGLIATVVSAILERRERLRFNLLLAASLCALTGAVLTAVGNVPLNERILTWSSASPPANWPELVTSWRKFHLARTILTTSSLVLLILAALLRRETPESLSPELGVGARGAPSPGA